VKLKSGFCSDALAEDEVDAAPGAGSVGLKALGAGVGPGKANPEELGFCSADLRGVAPNEGVVEACSAGLNAVPLAAVPKLNPVDFGSVVWAEVVVSAGLPPKLKPPPSPDPNLAPLSAGLDPKSPPLDPAEPPVLAPKADVAGGGPAGVVELPKLKALVLAGVVEPNSGAADVVAGLLVDDLSGVPNPEKTGLFSVEPAVAAVFGVPAALEVAGVPKLKPAPVEPVFPNRPPC
jgi:hypothetical protein